MDSRENFYINNYAFFGSTTQKHCGLSNQESKAIKEKYKKRGVYMLPIRRMAEDKLPSKNGKQTEFSAITFAVSSLDIEDQEKIIELAKNMPEPESLIDQSIAIQQYRVKVGLQNEYDQGRLLDTTETAISNLINMIQAKKTISDGQEVNLNVKSTISSLIDEIDDEEKEDIINIDIDEINRKEALKELRLKDIDNIKE